jgi:predicted dienelactone hydrolase
MLRTRRPAGHIAGAALIVVALGACRDDGPLVPTADAGTVAAADDTSSTTTTASGRSSVGGDAAAPSTEPSATTTTASARPAPATAVTPPPTTTEPRRATATTTTLAGTAPTRATFELLDSSGPFGVGHTTITAEDPLRAVERTIDVWYPVPAGTTGTAARYSFTPELFLDSAVAVAGARPAVGPFPLVVYSHGSGGLRYIASFLTERLASYGFVVAAPDHTGNTAIDLLAGTTADPQLLAIDRPLDVTFVIDELQFRSTTTGDLLSGTVADGPVGVVGHSAGGYTAIATATGHVTELDAVEPDSRVGAVVAMAPATGALTDEELARLAVPTLLIGGDADTTTPIDPNMTRPWRLMAASPAYFVEIEGAGHQTFTDVCTYDRVLPTLANVPDVVLATVADFAADGCGPGFRAEGEAHDLVDTYTIAFLQTHLAGRRGFSGSLAPDAVGAPDGVRVLTR